MGAVVIAARQNNLRFTGLACMNVVVASNAGALTALLETLPP